MIPPPKFSARESVKFAWAKTNQNLRPLITLTLINIGIQFLPALLKRFSSNLGILGSIISFILGSMFSFGIIKISLKIVDGKSFSVDEIFKLDVNQFCKYVGARIITILIVIGGMLLLIIPGLIWGYKYFFSGYLVIDQKTGVMDSIKKSGELTYGSKWKLCQLTLLIAGVNILGFLCVWIGLLFTIPMTYIALAYAFRKLSPLPVVDQVY